VVSDTGLWGRPHRRTTAGLLTLVTLIAFESMAVGTAMPTAVTELDGLAWYAWPFSAFLVASVVGMVLGGEAGDRRGARLALPLGVGTFAAGLLVSGVAQHMAVLVAGRAVQGLGAGVMVTLLYVIAGHAYEAELRPRLFGAISAAWVLPALVGPLVAGLVTTHASWRLVFFGLLPLVAVGLLLVVSASRLRTATPGEGAARRSNVGWALLAGLGIGLLQYAGQRLDGVGLAVAVAGAGALAAGLRPLLPAGTTRVRRGLPAVVASRGLLAGAFFGVDALLPLTLTAADAGSYVRARRVATQNGVTAAQVARVAAGQPQVHGVDHGLLHRDRHPVGRDRLAPGHLGQRQLAALPVELLEAVEAVARVAQDLAGLADVAELLRQLQQAHLGPDHLAFGAHGRFLPEEPAPAKPNCPIKC